MCKRHVLCCVQGQNISRTESLARQGGHRRIKEEGMEKAYGMSFPQDLLFLPGSTSCSNWILSGVLTFLEETDRRIMEKKKGRSQGPQMQGGTCPRFMFF